ncbi:MAG TPA: NAD(P)H-binding protein [Candidatus Dormibacteraeota bacterium]|nr:NAD(P)H-binding protein [Candidatus Dormibacteraeota bacterium]
MYAVLGATGNTGSVVARRLLDRGKKVRVIGRDNKKLDPFVTRGAEAFAADVLDTDALSRAFADAQGVYALIPPNMTSPDLRAYQDQVTESIAKALEKGGVAHAVTLSSVGADKPDKTGPVVGLYKMELRLAEVRGLNALHLRAGYFMENTLAQVGIIKSFGMMAGPLRADVPLPMIATRDIGVAAAEALLRLDFKRQQTQELLGPRNVTYAEAAKIIGSAIGKPDLAYVQLSDEQVIEAMTRMGISRNIAQLLCGMSAAINSGYMKSLERRSDKNTTPTTFEEFVQEVFLPAFRGQGANA